MKFGIKIIVRQNAPINVNTKQTIIQTRLDVESDEAFVLTQTTLKATRRYF